MAGFFNRSISSLALGDNVTDSSDITPDTYDEVFDPTAALKDEAIHNATFNTYTPGQELHTHMADVLRRRQREVSKATDEEAKKTAFLKGLLG